MRSSYFCFMACDAQMPSARIRCRSAVSIGGLFGPLDSLLTLVAMPKALKWYQKYIMHMLGKKPDCQINGTLLNPFPAHLIKQKYVDQLSVHSEICFRTN